MSKRDDYIEWSTFFMMSAALSAERSKDPCTQVGAVIVNDENRIISTGYNGFCNGISDDNGKWGKHDPDPMNNKKMFVCHAEMNAIVHSESSCKNCTMYVTHHPCNECAKLIIQSGIRRVLFAKHWKKEHAVTECAQLLFHETGVCLEQYTGPMTMTLNLK
jgi:dCMP deaminase